MRTLSWPVKRVRRWRAETALIAFSLLMSLILRADIISGKQTFSHDEGISLLSATCHQGAYSRIDFDLTPRPASEWKALLQVDQRFCFKQISSDLGHSDIHPPLYFWLLHVWSLIWGVDVWTGPFLNSVFALANLLILYRLANDALKRKEEAVLVLYTYALNYSVISISAVAKQYDLLAFLTLLLVWTALRYVGHSLPGWRQAWPLFILSMAGMLTHYHFFLPVTGCALYLLLKLKRRSTRSMAVALSCVGLGGVASLLIHPYVLTASGRQMGGFGVFLFTPESFALRLMKLGVSLSAYFYVILLAAVVFTLYILKQWRSHCNWTWRWQQVAVNGGSMLFYSVWLAGGVALLYLSSITPLHQMGPRYFAMAWPFLSFLPVLVLRLVRHRKSVALALYIFPLVLSLALAAQSRSVRSQRTDPELLLSTADLVLVDNVTRGIFPRIFWEVPDESQIIAAEQDSLLNQPETWMTQLTEDFTYVSEVSYASTADGRENIILLLEGDNYRVAQVARGYWDDGTLFEVTKQGTTP